MPDMKVACLTVRNFLGISEAKIAPKGKVTVLAGDNKQGKSSVLKAIPACFQGMKPAMIHNGAERLDEKTRAEFIRQADGDEFYYFVTRVGEPRPGEIEIKEGRVA